MTAKDTIINFYLVDVHTLYAREYYFGVVSGYYIDKCTNGEITEEELEEKLDYLEGKKAIQLQRIAYELRRKSVMELGYVKEYG